MILWNLFLSFLQIGAFSFGGGYAAIPLIHEQVISLHEWMNVSQFNDLIAISQMTPGPIAINSATFIGLEVGGMIGAICATLACILPSCIIVSIIAKFYLKYKDLSYLQEILSFLRPAIVSLIASAGGTMIIAAFWKNGIIQENTFVFYHVLMFAVALWMLQKKKINPILTMLIMGIVECGIAFL